MAGGLFSLKLKNMPTNSSGEEINSREGLVFKILEMTAC